MKGMSFRSVLGCGLLAAAMMTCAPSTATIIFDTGNQQYTNINFDASDPTLLNISGEVDQDNVFMDFTAEWLGTPVLLHSSHGVAAISVNDPINSPNETFDTMDVFPDPANIGFAWTGMDFKLDGLNGEPAGTVQFTAIDNLGNTFTSALFAIDATGQQPFHLHAIDGESITHLTIVSTLPLVDIKQVSVDGTLNGVPLPEPATVALLGLGLVGLAFFRSRPS